MNRHQKLALFVAPFLLITGYIAADYYAEHKQAKDVWSELKLEGECQLADKGCVLTWDQLTAEFFNQQGQTRLSSTHPLTAVVLTQVLQDSTEVPYQMSGDPDGRNWSVDTGFSPNDEITLRLVISVNNTFLFKEFNATVVQ